MDSKGEALYSPTQNFNDEDFKSESEVGDDKNKEITKKSSNSKTKSKETKKSKKNHYKKNRRSSHSSSKSKSRSRNGSQSSKSNSPESNRSSSSSKSPSTSKSRERMKRSKHRKESQQRSRRDNSRRISSKHRQTRSRENRRHRYMNDPYKYHSPRRESRDKRHNIDVVNERRHDRGDRGRNHGRGQDDQNYWRRDRSEHYRDNARRGEAWNNKGYDKYKENRDEEKRHNSNLRDENISGNKSLNNETHKENQVAMDKNKIEEPSKNLDDGPLIIPKQHIKRLENFEVKSQQLHNFDSQNTFEPRIQSNYRMQQSIAFESRPPFNFESRPPLGFESRPPLPFETKPNTALEPRAPIQFPPNFRDSRPALDNSTNLIQLRPGMPFTPNQPIIGPPNQQFRIIGPPRQQGGLVFRPVQIMEPGLDWRMDIRLPMMSQSGTIPITANSIMYRGPPVEFQRNQIGRPLLPLPQMPPQIQLPLQGIHLRPGGSSPPPPPPPVRFIINQVEPNNRFIQPGEFNRFSSPLMETDNRFHQSVVSPMQLELSNFNPNIPPPNITQQFIPDPPQPLQPSSPQTPLQSEEQILDTIPSPKQDIKPKENKHQYSPYSMNSEPDLQYDAYQDDLFADNDKLSSNTPSPASPNTDDQLESTSKKILEVSKARSPQEEKLSTNCHEQHRLEAKIAPFSIGSQKKQSLNNPVINQVFGTVATPVPKPLSPIPIPGLSDSVVDSLEQLTSLLNSASSAKTMDFKQPDFSSLASFVASQSPLQEDLDIPMDLAANASQQTIQLARQLGLFELTKVLEQASGNAEIGKDIKEKTEMPKKEKSTDCDSALIPLLCVHG